MCWLCGVGVFGLIECSHSLSALHSGLKLIIIIIIICSRVPLLFFPQYFLLRAWQDTSCYVLFSISRQPTPLQGDCILLWFAFSCIIRSIYRWTRMARNVIRSINRWTRMARNVLIYFLTEVLRDFSCPLQSKGFVGLVQCLHHNGLWTNNNFVDSLKHYKLIPQMLSAVLYKINTLAKLSQGKLSVINIP